LLSLNNQLVYTFDHERQMEYHQHHDNHLPSPTNRYHSLTIHRYGHEFDVEHANILC
jgi:hypothetical protein